MSFNIKRFIIIFLVLAFIYHFYIGSKNSSKLFKSFRKFKEDPIDNGFEILTHPLTILGARNLVSYLRESQSGSAIPPPKSLKFRKTSFAPQSTGPCDKGTDVLIMIKSSTGNQVKRQVNRDTWANRSYLSKFRVKIKYAFILGESSPKQTGVTAQELISEANEYGDVILGDFLDTCRNLTYKTLAGYKWALEFCPDLKFYVSLDDDTYISISNLIRFLESPLNYSSSTLRNVAGAPTFIPHDEHLYAGDLSPHIFPIRNTRHKWYLSPEEYPFLRFPPYLYGYFLLISWKTLQSFHSLSPYMNPELWIDDLYLGEMANELRISPLNMRPSVSKSERVNVKSLSCEPDSNFYKHYIALHNFGPMKERRALWEKLNCLNDLRNGLTTLGTKS